MSGLRARLASGACGAAWTPPADTEVKIDDERQLLVVDPRRGVLWNVVDQPLPFAFDSADDAALRTDIVASACALFEGERPHADDPTWSPVIEQGRVELRGGPALRVVRRLAFAPGKEIVVGHVVVPLATGHLDLRVIARASTTGMRESAISLMSGVLAGRKRGESAAWLERAVYDDYAYDAKFPDHPLSLVRTAIAQICESIEIRARARLTGRDEVELEPHRCALVPPARYTPVPADALTLGPRMLVRCGLESWYRSLEIWRVDDHPFRRADPRPELCALARKTVEGWAAEGAGDIETEVVAIDDFAGRPQAQQAVSLCVGAEQFRTLFRWWVEADGVVYRLGAGGPRVIPDADYLATLAEAQATWRRLDPIAAPASSSRRPWWRVL